jgi:predicted phosphodiesterase
MRVAYPGDMRLALISDLHANLLALDAVLRDARRAGFDRLVCLGDVVTLGPRPGAVLERLQALGCPCILGNHDEFMFEPALIRTYTDAPAVVASIEATRQSLSAAEVTFLRSFVRTLRVDDVFLYHGTPRSNIENLLATTPADDVDVMLGDHGARVCVGGHTHLPMLRQHRGALIVNVGSVGTPFRDFVTGGPPTILPHAEYAIVDVSSSGVHVDLRRVSLDRMALAAQAADWENPLAAMLRGMYA